MQNATQVVYGGLHVTLYRLLIGNPCGKQFAKDIAAAFFNRLENQPGNKAAVVGGEGEGTLVGQAGQEGQDDCIALGKKLLEYRLGVERACEGQVRPRKVSEEIGGIVSDRSQEHGEAFTFADWIYGLQVEIQKRYSVCTLPDGEWQNGRLPLKVSDKEGR